VQDLVLEPSDEEIADKGGGAEEEGE